MSDWQVREAERRGDEAAAYADWIDDHEEDLLETYREVITIDDLPDDFISNQYEQYLENAGEEERDRDEER